MEYVKINSLWKREGWYFDQDKKNSPDYQAGRQSFIIGDYSEPEFGNIKKWRVDEKIDGTNIRVQFINSVRFKGRTENAQIPPNLFDHLQKTFTFEKMAATFPLHEDGAYPIVTLFGEGYGPKIQAGGGNYRKEVGFILFDIVVGGWWLKREDVTELAKKMEIPVVPDLGIMSEDEIVEFVKSKPLSKCSQNPQMMEGIIARSEPLMLFRNGKPLMWKLKCKEF